MLNMINKLFHLRMPLSATAISFFLLACIPKEDPLFRLTLDSNQTLPSLLQENSGMTQAGDLIWFLNDGGNEPALYGYDIEQQELVRTIVINHTVNTDWEDLTQYGSTVYIGNFGNNEAGNRTDLSITLINRTDLISGADTIEPTGTIHYTYEDQLNYDPWVANTTPFDCEAFIATDDSLYLFAKDWQNQRTRVYSLSNEPGTQVAKVRAEWNVSGLITSAAWDPGLQKLYLLGYTDLPYMPFLWVMSGFSPSDLSYTEAKRTDFSGFLGVQVESIMVASNGQIYISNEQSVIADPTLFVLTQEAY
jgi:hypothetical protein